MTALPTRRTARRRWVLAAALVGTLAAGAAWAWPDAPLWQTGPEAGQLASISSDSRVVVTTLTPPAPAGGHPADPELLRWDGTTGTLLSRATLACADPQSTKSIRPSPDGRRVLVGEQVEGPREPKPAPRSWYLHDGIDG